MSPTQSNIYLEEIIMICFNGKREITVVGRKIECIRFTDDTEVLAESNIKWYETIGYLNKACENLDM